MPACLLTLLPLLCGYPPLREVGIAYLSERSPLTKVLGSTFHGKPTVQKLRGNFSENTPEAILVWGQDGMDTSPAEGAWEGDDWGREFSCSHAAVNHTTYPSNWADPHSPGEGSGQRIGQGPGERQCKTPRGTQS